MDALKPISVILIGAGLRGDAYTTAMSKMPEKFRVVAVAEPEEGRRNVIRDRHAIPEEKCFSAWQEILSRPKMADVCLICTMDDMHYEVAMKAISLGYDLVLEKPVAQTAEECTAIAHAAKEKGVKVLVCHVLRYTPFYNQIKRILMDGTIGKIMSGIFVEGVGHIHQSHSFVRGNWHSEKETTPMLLAKSCHHLDIIQWLLHLPCRRVQSFGKLTYFRKENAPEGAPVRCIDGTCPIVDTCRYACKKLYYDDKENLWLRQASTRGIAKGAIPTDEEVMTALKTTDYGLCVFHANNDVVDQQTVNMEFEGGVTATLSMNAFNKGGRYIRLFGTKGELYANFADPEITVYTFQNKEKKGYPIPQIDESIVSGHGGGDSGLVMELFDYLSGDYKGYSAADIEISVKNHLIGFAAEKSRRDGTVESIDEFFAKYKMENH